MLYHRITPLGLACIAALVCSTAGRAWGGDGISPLRLEVTANFNAASVYAFFEGDDNRNASVRMEYRTAGGDWRPGHPLTRTARGRYAGSIFDLQPDQDLEVRVGVSDPDVAAPPKPLQAATRTRSDRFPGGTGRMLYVRHGGADPGEKNVCASLQEAVDLAQPGDTIVLRAGDYFESVTVRRSGRADAYITIRADGPADGLAGGPAVRLVGYDNAPLRGLSAPGPARVWQRGGDGLYVLDEKRPVGTLLAGGRRLYHHGTLEDLKAAQAPLAAGWFHDAKAGRLYLRPEKDAPPPMADLAIGVLPLGLSFQDCGYWIVEGLEFRGFGGGLYSRGIDAVNARNIVVRRCTFEGMRTGVSLRKGGTTQCLVERCTFRDSGIWTWPWKAVKAHDTEGSAISIRGGAGNVARGNEITGFFNGIDASTWGDLDNEALNRDLDIHDNRFVEIGDDPLEPEGACMNVRFWNNRTRQTLMGISLAPITVGPVYVVRDRYVDFKSGAVKVSIESKGAVYLYHVAGWTDRPGVEAMAVCGPWDNMHFRNCILRGMQYVIEDRFPHPIGCSFDFCCLFSPAKEQFVKWSSQRYLSLDTLPREAGFGPDLLRLEPYEPARAGEPADLSPRLIDAGQPIPGVNDGFKGKAPDIGPDEVK